MTELMKRYEENMDLKKDSIKMQYVYDRFIEGFEAFAQEEYDALQSKNAQLKAQLTWRPASDKPEHGKTVLATYLNQCGKRRRVRAFYIGQYEEEEGSEDDELCVEYCEEKDEWYLKEGWYELIDNWDTYSSVAIVEGVVDYWMPMPPAPKGEVKCTN